LTIVRRLSLEKISLLKRARDEADAEVQEYRKQREAQLQEFVRQVRCFVC